LYILIFFLYFLAVDEMTKGSGLKGNKHYQNSFSF
jgi:hypothetical protein